MLGRVSLSLFLLVAPVAEAQQFDPFRGEGAALSVHMSAMLWLGLEQGIIESCNGDVSRNGQRFLTFANAAEAKMGSGYAQMLAGFFGEGIKLGSGLGCDVDALRNYSSWADAYYDPALADLLR